METQVALVVFVSLLMILSLVAAADRSVRGPWRLAAIRFGSKLALAMIPVLLFVLTRPAGNSTSESVSQVSDWLGVSTALVSFALGAGGHMFGANRALPRVVVVIPSQAEFFRDVRLGFRTEIQRVGVHLDLHDEFDSSQTAEEDLVYFTTCLRLGLDRRPDFVVVHAPSDDVLADPTVHNSLVDHVKRGGYVFFLECSPVESTVAKTWRNRILVIRSDSLSGAKLMAEYLASVAEPNATIAVLAGPRESVPAKERKAELVNLIPQAAVHIADTAGWSPDGARSALRRLAQGGQEFDFVVCGNDEMALAVVDEIRRTGTAWNGVSVVGYDGVIEAMFAIAEHENPMIATVRIPPSAYGERLAVRIIGLSKVWSLRNAVLPSNETIPISSVNLITTSNVRRALRGMR